MIPPAEHDPLPLVLASASPRRRTLLTRAGLDFEVIPANVPEERRPGEAPALLARRLARQKATAVARRLGTEQRRWVLGADTIVVLEDRVLGKPRDPEHAVELLGQLVGRRHVVITGIAVAGTRSLEVCDESVESEVFMREAEPDELRAYVATGEPLDKAGAYALQGAGRRFVDRVEGSESNVIGLPLEQTLALLQRAGACRAAGRT